MQRYLVGFFIVLCMPGMERCAYATEFAVLRQRFSDEPKLVADNPLYQAGGSGGTNPLFEPAALEFNPADIWNAGGGQPVDFTVTTGADLLMNLPNPPTNAFVFQLSLNDDPSGPPIHQLAQPVSIFADLGANSGGNFVLGSLDESVNPPVWSAQSQFQSTGSNPILCGTTNHFSYFFIEPVPEPSTLVLAALASGALALRVGRRRKAAIWRANHC